MITSEQISLLESIADNPNTLHDVRLAIKNALDDVRHPPIPEIVRVRSHLEQLVSMRRDQTIWWDLAKDAYDIIKSRVVKHWSHLKRGSLYLELCRGELQIATTPPKEGDTLVVYMGDDKRVWIRWDQEFEDGRFVKV